MTLDQATWFVEIAKACDELELGIVRVEPGRIQVDDLATGTKASIEIDSIFLSGAELRRLIRPAAERRVPKA